MVVPPPGSRQRPASARARLLTSKEQTTSSSVLSHGSKDPPPDSDSVQSGPGHYRHFGPGSRHAFRDPLRQGQERRDLPFYSMGNRNPSRENGIPMRTLDVAKVNQDRHQWQRVDTFQTPHGNGQAVCSQASCRETSCGNTSQQRTRTASRSLERGSQAVAGLGLEVEDLRLELRSAVSEIKEDLASAVNQTIAELRQDVRAEAASLREQLNLQNPPPSESRSEVVEAMLQELAKEIDKVREELSKGQHALADELRVRIQIDGSLMGQVQDLRAKVDRVAQSSADILKNLLEIDIPSNGPVIDEVKKCQAQLFAVADCQTQLRSSSQESAIAARETLDQGLSSIVESLNSVDKSIDSHLQTLSSDVQGTMALVRELDAAEIFAGFQSSLFKVQQWQCDFDLSPILAAVHAAVDLNPLLRASHETQEAQGELSRFVRSHHEQISTVLSEIEHRAQSSTRLQEATKSEIASLLQMLDSLKAKSQTDLDTSSSLHHIMMAIGKIDTTCLQSELQRVHDEVREVRRGSQQLQVRQEEDSAQVQRAFQERKRADDELSDRLVEEMHKMRRDFDLSEVLMAVQQLDAAKMLKAIRDSRVNPEDLAPVSEELRRLAEEVRQSRFAARDLTQLLDELTSLKVEVLRQGRREPDFSSIISEVKSAVKDRKNEVDFSEVFHEFQILKEFLASQRAKELKDQAQSISDRQDTTPLTKSLEDICSRAVARLDLSQVTSEISAVKAKIELSSALKRQTQTDHLTKADFAAAFEELRGHFSLLLNSLREVKQPQQYAAERRGLETAAEDFNYVRRKVRDAQCVAGQAGSRTAELLQQVQGRRGQPGKAFGSDESTLTAFAEEVSSSFM
eukprot:TRINITY_DN6696_c0_g1_i2.p1 TRINITY_DN6696_c0_g1~~TRINITY_DN6696_c0_g1_i2.p1  ORF type:complete len:870 (-),score=197.81 TRINITY_DN6696_c0_g1_i2:231-2792(-)